METSSVHRMHASHTDRRSLPPSLDSRLRARRDSLALSDLFSCCLHSLLLHRGLTSKNYISQTPLLLEICLGLDYAPKMLLCKIWKWKRKETTSPTAVGANEWASVCVFLMGKIPCSTMYPLASGETLADASRDPTPCKNNSGVILCPHKQPSNFHPYSPSNNLGSTKLL